jgi:hypothetical protein
MRRVWRGAARLERHRSDGRLGLGDALIAAVARGLEATIVTRNRPDFERQGAAVLAYLCSASSDARPQASSGRVLAARLSVEEMFASRSAPVTEYSNSAISADTARTCLPAGSPMRCADGSLAARYRGDSMATTHLRELLATHDIPHRLSET